MTLQIHGVTASRALRPLWAAAALGLPCEQVQVGFKDGGSRQPGFMQLNPNGHIPVLVDDTDQGRLVMWESMACTLYIAQQHGKADGIDISPAGPLELAAALQWAFWTANEIESNALAVLMHVLGLPPEQRDADKVSQAQAKLHAPLTVLENHLASQQANGQDFIAAARFTVADICVASVVEWVKPAKEWSAQFAHTMAWLNRCLHRPEFVALRAAARQPSKG